MQTIEHNRFIIELPTGYAPPKLPGRNEWVAALRSGDYKQGRSKLKYATRTGLDHRYCCLGVLCQINDRPEHDFGGGHPCTFDGGASGLTFVNPLHQNLGSMGVFPSGILVQIHSTSRRCSNLANCNDSGLTFNDIATIIETVWEHED